MNDKAINPDHDCPLCPRLVAFRNNYREIAPDWFNGPVQNFGSLDSRLLIVGLAPGLNGAHRTGRPFTGDYAGDLLYNSLIKFGFAKGTYQADPNDGLQLVDCLITNSVRCVPPQNKPTPLEITQCSPFIASLMQQLPRLSIILVLGRVAHESFLRACGLALKSHPFSHGARHQLDPWTLYDSYHCSRYNTQTGVLTTQMFETVISSIRKDLDVA